MRQVNVYMSTTRPKIRDDDATDFDHTLGGEQSLNSNTHSLTHTNSVAAANTLCQFVVIFCCVAFAKFEYIFRDRFAILSSNAIFFFVQLFGNYGIFCSYLH